MGKVEKEIVLGKEERGGRGVKMLVHEAVFTSWWRNDLLEACSCCVRWTMRSIGADLNMLQFLIAMLANCYHVLVSWLPANIHMLFHTHTS